MTSSEAVDPRANTTLVVGGTGELGGQVVRALKAEGRPVRVLTRSRPKAATLRERGIGVVRGDLCDPSSLPAALAGVKTVIATAHGAEGSGATGPKQIEGLGYPNLISAAQAAHVQHFVYVSSANASPESPSPFFRLKAKVEADLRASGLWYSILRPTHLMETWAAVLAEPIIKKSKAMIFGSGDNPISFVAARDVAQGAATLVLSPATNQAFELGGPENLTLNDVVSLVERALKQTVKRQKIAVPMMRVSSKAIRPFNEVLARQMQFGILIATRPQTVESSALWQRLGIQPETFSAWLLENLEALETSAQSIRVFR